MTDFVLLTGKRGSGKSYFATMTALECLKKGLNVWANYVLDFRGVKDMPEGWQERCFYSDSLDDIAFMRDGVFLFDESHWKLSARGWKDLKIQTHEYLAQSRKLHMAIFLVSQHAKRLDSIAIELADYAYEFHKFGRLHWYWFFEPEVLKNSQNPKPISKIPSVFFRTKKIQSCYDTDALFGSLSEPLGAKSFRPNGCGLEGVSVGVATETPPPVRLV